MNRNSVFRANARAQLGGNIFNEIWLLALAVCFIQSLVLSLASSIVIGVILVGGLLSHGMAHVFLQMVRSQKTKPEIPDLFSGSDQFLSLLILYCAQALFTFLWALLFFVPGIVKSYAYSMAFYIKHDHPDYDWKKCLDESQRYMKGNKWQLFCLDFSFIGWILLGSCCCGLGMLWVTPYQQLSHANFYENLKAIYDPEIIAEEAPVEPEII